MAEQIQQAKSPFGKKQRMVHLFLLAQTMFDYFLHQWKLMTPTYKDFIYF